MKRRTIITIIALSCSIFAFFMGVSRGDEKEIVTPLGNVYVGMSESKLYEIFQEKDRILIPHNILSKKWVVFRDITSKNPHDVITFYLDAGYITGWKRGYDSAPLNKGSIYEYVNNEKVEIWFFPEDNARWNGSKLNLLEWNKLEHIQKVMFIKEYITEINKKHNTNIVIDVDKYVMGMNYFTDNCPEFCRQISAADAVNNLLISDGKAAAAPSPQK